MTRHSEFKMETRRYGDGYSNFVQIVCGWCEYEAWFPAKNGGWAMRIFRAHGWKVGSKPQQHRCPKCFGKAMAARRAPDNPAIPKEIGKALKIKLKEAHVKDALMATSALHPRPEKPARDPLYLADLIVPAAPEKAPEPAPEPVPEPIPAEPVPEPALGILRPVRGKHSVPGRTVFTQRSYAANSATSVTGSVDGIEFFTLPLADGWTWKHARDVTPEEQRVWRETRKYGAVPKKVSLARMAATPKEEPTMTAEITPLRKDPMPTTEPLAVANEIVATMADPARQPNRDERQLIHDELTKTYDLVSQRYAGQDSDANVAGRLDVPRVWVTDIRAMFFGDHDRNAATEKQIAGLDQAIALAGSATKRLLEMATEAETLERGLVAARKKLVG